MKKTPLQHATSSQLSLSIEVEGDVDGIEMGVLENGIPYLTQRGLASVCGIGHRIVYDITKEWEEHFNDGIIGKDRISFIREYLFSKGYKEDLLYLEISTGGAKKYAYPDIVCTAILEYYAFEAKNPSKEALKKYRAFSQYGIQQFIYKALDYNPENKWKYYIDRVSLLKNNTPAGYFTIFQEIGHMVVDLIDAGLTVNDKTIPDISVGKAWGSFWTDNGLGQKTGERIKYKHEYPSYYPQSMSNPQHPWAYPDEALPIFREWFKNQYLAAKFPKYILTKANILPGGKSEAERMIEVFEEKRIEQMSSFNKSLKKALDYDPKK